MTLRQGDACPACKVGKMIIKQGRYGRFLGCDMFRHTGCVYIGKLATSENKDPLELQTDEILKQNNKEYLIV